MSTGICPNCRRRVSLSDSFATRKGLIGWHKLRGRACPGWHAKPLPPVYPEETT